MKHQTSSNSITQVESVGSSKDCDKQSAQPKVYYPFLDALWFFSAIFIIWFHTPPRFEPSTDDIVWYIGVALFFFISGCLFHTENVPANHFWKRIFKRLLWPSLVCYLFFYLLWVLFGRYHAGIEDLNANWYDPLIQLALGQPSLVCATLWFVVALAVIQCFSYYVLKRGTLSILVAVSLLLAVAASLITLKIFCINFVSIFLIWHTLGMCFQRLIQKHKILNTGEQKKWLARIKQAGVLILAFQNYVIGCLKLLFNHFNVDLLTAPLYMKFIVALLSVCITMASALLVDRMCPFITNVSLFKSRKLTK